MRTTLLALILALCACAPEETIIYGYDCEGLTCHFPTSQGGYSEPGLFSWTCAWDCVDYGGVAGSLEATWEIPEHGTPDQGCWEQVAVTVGECR